MLYLLRQTPVKTLKHLPKFLSTDDDLKNTALISDDEHERLRVDILDVKNQLFVETATWGLSDWERVLNIPIKENTSVTDRKTQVLLKLQSANIVSNQFMLNIINRFLNDNSAKIIQYNDMYYFDVIFNKDSCFDINGLTEAVELYKPAHLGFRKIEQQNLDSEIFIGSKAAIAETIFIEPDTGYVIEPMEKDIFFGAKLSIAEIIVIGSE